jgi:hypothetical protein
MSTLAIVLIVFAAVVLIALLLGFLGARARDRRQADTWRLHVAEADAALEQARASDRGWDRDAMVTVARGAIAGSRPDWPFDELHLVLVDDKPGTDEDRARFVAMGQGGDQARVLLTRQGDRWVAEPVDWAAE